MNESVLILDIETDSLKVEEANLKWFGCWSYKTNKGYVMKYTQKENILEIIKNHKYIVTFNGNSFDLPILSRFLETSELNYKIILDLWEVLAPKGNGTFGIYNRNRLVQMGYKPENYKLKTIVKELGLDEEGKGEIDYNLFKKNEWSESEEEEIRKYLRQDIEITKKLFEWYYKQFEPLEKFLPGEEVRRWMHLRENIPKLAYSVMNHKVGALFEGKSLDSSKFKPIAGGHHINAREELVAGNIVYIDFTSAYPHALMMGNLFSPAQEGWNGNGYFKIDGTYNNKEMGKAEKAIQEIFLERLAAKKNGDKAKSVSYKLIINSIYGLTGNQYFTNLYNPTTANDCTHMVRTWLKKLAKSLEENGFIPLYGFTDGMYIKIPENLSKEDLFVVVNDFINEVKSNVPFPLDTFGIEIEEECKMLWVVTKNCYLRVTNKDEIKYKSTLLNKNTPACVMKVFEEYMSPKIVSELNVNFSKQELSGKLLEVLNLDPELAAESYSVNPLFAYKVQTSIHYQISEKYGEGEHLLIPNLGGLGIGKDKGTKNRKPLRYCKVEEFKAAGLKAEDIDLSKMLKWLKPFMRSEKE